MKNHRRVKPNPYSKKKERGKQFKGLLKKDPIRHFLCFKVKVIFVVRVIMIAVTATLSAICVNCSTLKITYFYFYYYFVVKEMLNN